MMQGVSFFQFSHFTWLLFTLYGVSTCGLSSQLLVSPSPPHHPPQATPPPPPLLQPPSPLSPSTASPLPLWTTSSSSTLSPAPPTTTSLPTLPPASPWSPPRMKPTNIMIEEIKQKVSLSGVMNYFLDLVDLRGDDDRVRCVCPFHNDHNPSMLINEGPGYYYCFTCHVSGNFLKFLSHKLHLSESEIYYKVASLMDSDDALDSWLEEVSRPLRSVSLQPIRIRSARKTATSSTTTIAPIAEKRGSISGSSETTGSKARSSSTMAKNTIQAAKGINSSIDGANYSLDESMASTSIANNSQILSALELGATYYFSRLFMDPIAAPVREYLQSRRISVNTAKAFRLGYAPMPKFVKALARKAQEDNNSTESPQITHIQQKVHHITGLPMEHWLRIRDHTATTYLLSNLSANLGKTAFSQQEVVDAGLAVNSSYYNSLYDRFRNRLMVPIFDPQGRVVAFGGRELPDEVNRAITAIHRNRTSSTDTSLENKDCQGKYINSPSTSVFEKKKLLFGSHLAAEACSQQHLAIIVEGYFDVISLHEIGVRHAMACMGTALSIQQLLLAATLLKGFGSIVLLLDNDSAGQQALERVQKIVIKHNQSILKRRQELPYGRVDSSANSSLPSENVTANTVAIKVGSWGKATDFVAQEHLSVRRLSGNESLASSPGTSKEEIWEECTSSDAKKIKDCGDLCLLFHASDARRIVEHITSTATEICQLYLD